MKKIITFALLFMPAIVSAQGVAPSPDDWGFNDFSNSNIALGSKPLRDTIGGVVNIILGFLGILTTLAIIFGGFTMMTSYGNSEKNDQGRGVVVAGAVGLIIVLTAYAISRFVLSNLFNQTVA